MYKRITFVVSAALLLGACGVPSSDALVGGEIAGDPELASEGQELSSSRAQAWFPLAEGNSWELESATSSKTIRIEYIQNNVALLTGLFADDLWIGLAPSTPNTLYAWDDYAGRWNTMIRFGYAVTPWKWSTSATCRSFDAKRASTGTSYVTAAGTFSDTRTISFAQIGAPNVRCEAPAFSEIGFAANVGIVTLVSGGERYTLKSAHVGTKSYPAVAQGKLTTTVRSDATSYVNHANTIRCITAPCPSNEQTATATFTMRVTNGTSSVQKLSFSSGKQFDFELIDAAGKVVKAYGDGRIYTMALTAITLNPGQSKDFIASMELKDRDGNQLRGSYQVRGIVPLSTGALEAKSSFSVSVVE